MDPGTLTCTARSFYTETTNKYKICFINKYYRKRLKVFDEIHHLYNAVSSLIMENSSTNKLFIPHT